MNEQQSDKKPQLHWSAVSMFMKCPEAYRRRYVENEIIPPSVRMIIGSAVHETAESDLKHKCHTEGELLPDSDIKDMARDNINGLWKQGVELDHDEQSCGVIKVAGQAVDSSVRMASAHHRILAPEINPVDDTHVEKKWVLHLPNKDYDLAGTIDVVEDDCIRDLKTGGKSKSQANADESDQLTLYALQHYVETGNMVSKLALDYTANLKGGVKADTLWTFRDKSAFQPLLNRVDACAESIEYGLFHPTDQSNWWCGPKFCGYAHTCKFYL